MHSAMVKLAEELKNVSFGTPSMPVYCNYEARVVEGPTTSAMCWSTRCAAPCAGRPPMQKLVDQGHRLSLNWDRARRWPA